MDTPANSQDYYVVEHVISDGDIPITMYANRITGLRVVNALVQCPIVKGDFVFATEAFDDDGLPHTLEHLVFLGSEDYPYKGVLDLLANRSLADGTNAYTDTDHTNYTISTAGADGFLNLLPIYLDHLLFPTLTDAGFVTEVHHINGNGEDAGVVYCEMQARENSGDSRCCLEMMRSLYPGKCGYSSETGGIMENLRTSTTNEKVRQYHKEFYHSKNLCIIVTGSVEADAIFKAIKPIDDKIVAKGMHNVKYTRPWSTPVEPLENSIERVIQYPSNTDDDGLVYIGFRGPKAINNFKEITALAILLEYLNSTSISPIQRDFVECEEPYCSSISHSIVENSTSCFYFAFESVGKQYLELVCQKLFELLKNIATGKEKLDMDHMRVIISRKRVRILSVSETSPHSLVSGPVIGHFLYGSGELRERAQEIPLLDEFEKYEPEVWLNLMAKYMTDPDSARYVSIIGEPSPSLMLTMSEAENARVAKQKDHLKDKLSLLANNLKESIETNDRPAPPTMLNIVPIPSTDSIKFHPIERVVIPPERVPFRIQYDSIKTNFVTINLLMNTSHNLTKQDRLYLPLMTEVILECPIERDGALIPYEKIVAELFSDTITSGAGIGLASASNQCVGQISMMLGLMMQVEIDKYERAVKWFSELLYKTVFTPERIKTVATRLVSDISQYKRSGGKVLSSAFSCLAYQSNSNQWASNFMRQHKFLKNLLKEIKQTPDVVQREMTRIRDCLNKPNNILVHLALNKDKIDVSKIHEPWMKLFPGQVTDSSPERFIDFSDVISCNKLLQFIEEPKAAIVGVGSVESNYMSTLVRSIDSPQHPDFVAVMVLIQYITQLEGPFFKLIRGAGLSYHISISLSPSEGILNLLLYKSAQLLEAYNKSAEILMRYLDGLEEYEDNLLESAKSSLIFEIISKEKSAAGKSLHSLLAHLRNLPIDFNQSLIKKVADVTKDDMRRVGPLYLKPLFTDDERRTVICSNPSKVEELIKGFEDKFPKIEKMSMEKDSFWNSLE